MSNVDLLIAIEIVRYLRARLQNAQFNLDNAWTPEGEHQVDYFLESLAEAESELATVMIELQDGYDLALLPKQPRDDDFEPMSVDLSDIPF